MGHDDETDRSDHFKRRLKAARSALDEGSPHKASRSGSGGAGFKMGLELVSSVLVGAFMGFWIDRWIGTSPWAFIVLTLLGFVAGVMNLLKATMPGSDDDES